MNDDLISREALKKYKFTTQTANGVELEDIEVVPVAAIDNAPTVECERLTEHSLYAFDRGYARGYEQAKLESAEKFRQIIQKEKQYYSNGSMCSVSESVNGENICDDILRQLDGIIKTDKEAKNE